MLFLLVLLMSNFGHLGSTNCETMGKGQKLDVQLGSTIPDPRIPVANDGLDWDPLPGKKT